MICYNPAMPAKIGFGLFPPGSATLDCALLMRDIPVTWTAIRPAFALPGRAETIERQPNPSPKLSESVPQ